MKKRILIFDRFNSAQFPGGDTIQIRAIEKFLNESDYLVSITNNPEENLIDFDYVLIFNLTNPFEAYICAKAAIKFNKPYILFPVYWNLDDLKMPINKSFKSILKMLLPRQVKSYVRAKKFIGNNNDIIHKQKLNSKDFFSVEKVIEYVIKHAYYICPNSHAEWEHLEENFNLNKLNKNIKVIYNGVFLSELKQLTKDDLIKKKYNLPEKYICCVGGIGPRKNQLNLVKAANKAKVNLVIIGQSSNGYENYYSQVLKVAKENIYFVGQLSQIETFKIIKSSHGHVQPSFIETPGLASLEAVALGTKVVVAETRPVKEYFLDNAFYCNPRSIESISLNLALIYSDTTQYDNSWIGKYDWNKALFELKGIINCK